MHWKPGVSLVPWLGAFLFALAPTSCQSLETLELDLCGNGVVDFNEDCDNRADPGCHASGSNACRFRCDGSSVICPDGFACGSDQVCRAPSGTFSENGLVVAGPSTSLVAVDANDDGIDELLLTNDEAFTLQYIDGTRTLGTRTTIPARGAIPTLVDINDDNAKDLVFEANGSFLSRGLAVFLGRAGARSFSPLAFSQNTDFRADVITTVEGPGGLRDFAVGIGDGGIGVVGSANDVSVVRLDATGQYAVNLTGFATGPSTDAPGLDANLCELVVTAIADQSTLDVTIPCRFNPVTGGYQFPVGQPTQGVRLQEPVTPVFELEDSALQPPTVHLAHAPGTRDDFLDIIVSRPAEGCPTDPTESPLDLTCSIGVGFGQGAGAFRATPPASGPGPGATDVTTPESLDVFICESGRRALANDMVPPEERRLALAPLFVGDLDEDGRSDLVYAHGIYLERAFDRGNGGGTSSAFFPANCFDFVPLIFVDAGDFNGDGHRDLVAVTIEETVVLYINDGKGGFTENPVPESGFVTALSVGDVDGDGRDDTTYLAEGPQNTQFKVVFGDDFNAGVTTQEVAAIEDARALTTGRFEEEDAAAETLVTSDSSFTFFLGRSSRLLIAPYQIGGGVLLAVGEIDPSSEGSSGVMLIEDGSVRLVPISEATLQVTPNSEMLEEVWATTDYTDAREFGATRLISADVDGTGSNEAILVDDLRVRVLEPTSTDAWMLQSDSNDVLPNDTENLDGFGEIACESTRQPSNAPWAILSEIGPLAEDVDGDGDPDLVFVIFTTGPDPDGSSEDIDVAISVCIVKNENGSFDYVGGSAIPGVGMAFVDLDGRAPRELAISQIEADVANDGESQGDETPRLAIVDPESLTSSSRVVDINLTSEVVTAVSGDFDGDGVADIAVSDETLGTQIFFGVERVTNPRPEQAIIFEEEQVSRDPPEE